MKGVRDPLLWIGLASFVAVLPYSTVALPVSVALALSTQSLLRTQLGSQARAALLVAVVVAWFTSALHVGFLTASSIPFPIHRLAEISPSFTMLALATGLSRMAEIAAIEESALWLSAVRLLFLGGLVFDLLTGGAGVVIQFLACPVFAVLVLRMRARLALPSPR